MPSFWKLLKDAIVLYICWSAGPSCETVEEIGSQESLQYDFETIRFATNNFSDANKLGQGGFGAVYRVRT